MKRIIIVCEGQTEQSFCCDVLQPHFNHLGIYIDYPTIKKTVGGIVKWAELKKQIEGHLKAEGSVFVTTLIDYYGINTDHQYPQWGQAQVHVDKYTAITRISNAMLSDVAHNLQNRFIPYIQLHEFEGLLFSDIKVFENSFEASEFKNYPYLVATTEQYSNPELINTGKETAPSKRLSTAIKMYSKVVYGSLIAQEIGLPTIRAKCPGFNAWITRLENIVV
jgi:hypothetical protein